MFFSSCQGSRPVKIFSSDRHSPARKSPLLLLLYVLLGLGPWSACLQGCSRTYYNFWEALGKEKRDLLKTHIEKSHDNQKEVEKEFQDALERLHEMYGSENDALEGHYDKLQDEYTEAENSADLLKRRIKKVEEIAHDLFTEWETEAKTIKNRKFQRESLRSLQETRQKFNRLHHSLKQSEQTMQDVLEKFRDVVLYLKHKLNANALKALKREFSSIENDIRQLTQQMERSMSESSRFMETLD